MEMEADLSILNRIIDDLPVALEQLRQTQSNGDTQGVALMLFTIRGIASNIQSAGIMNLVDRIAAEHWSLPPLERISLIDDLECESDRLIARLKKMAGN